MTGEFSDLPAPPVPADADLKDFAFTPIYRARLFGSSFHARANDPEWRAGVTLWLKSQDQAPAGSLPDDDVELCRLAELGRDMKTWRKLRAGALHGWRKCNDGRLYNDVVAEVVNEQWQSKLDQRNRTLKGRIAALEKRLSQATDEQVKEDMGAQLQKLRRDLSQYQSQPLSQKEEPRKNRTVTTSVTESVTEPVTEAKRRDRDSKGTGTGIIDSSEADASGAVAPPPADAWKAIYDGFKRHLGTKAGGMISKLRQCSGEPEMARWLAELDAGAIAEPHEYFGKIIANRKGAAQPTIDPPSRIAYRKAFAEWDQNGRQGERPKLENFARLDGQGTTDVSRETSPADDLLDLGQFDRRRA